jgi:hypothetical protein
MKIVVADQLDSCFDVPFRNHQRECMKVGRDPHVAKVLRGGKGD